MEGVVLIFLFIILNVFLSLPLFLIPLGFVLRDEDTLPRRSWLGACDNFTSQLLVELQLGFLLPPLLLQLLLDALQYKFSG